MKRHCSEKAIWFVDNSSPIDNLIKYIIQGKSTEANTLLRKNPALLMEKGSGLDYSNVPIKDVTPLQAAFLRHDYLMLSSIEALFEEMDDGVNLRREQILKLCPDGHLPEQTIFDFSPIMCAIKISSDDEVKHALRHEAKESELAQALESFRAAFTLKSKNEPFYNLQHLMKVLDILRLYMNDCSQVKKNLVWCQVFGYVERFIPTLYAQVICHGMGTFLNSDKNDLKRQLFFADKEQT